MYYMTTGAVCMLLGVSEHKLVNLIRARRLTVPIEQGRRKWTEEIVREAARLVGRDAGDLRAAFSSGAAAETNALRLENERLREALRFYADEKGGLWEDAGDPGLGGLFRFAITGTSHPRKVARKALGLLE